MGIRNRALAFGLVMAAAASAGCKSNKLTFESVNPPTGRLSGAEEVRIRGSGFSSLANTNIEVRIGGRPATNVGIQGDDTLVLTTPEGREADVGHPIDINLLTADGRSIVLRNAFQYRPGPATGGSGGPNEELRRRL